MQRYLSKPWLSQYNNNYSEFIQPEFDNLLTMFEHACRQVPNQAAIHYFDTTLTYAEIDRMTDSMAYAFAHLGVMSGDRIAIYLQNIPQFVIALIASWKIGAVSVPVNPMNRERELRVILEDSKASLLICHEQAYLDIVQDLFLTIPIVTTSELDFQTRNDQRLFSKVKRYSTSGTHDFVSLLKDFAGRTLPNIKISSDDLAMLVYTSGTTGVPKGAMNTHGGAAFNAQVYRDWNQIKQHSAILGVAPLFHITGLIGHIAAAMITQGSLILAYRFEPGVILDALKEYRPSFTIGSITVFIALMNHPDVTADHFKSFEKIYSGGAPIPPSVVDEFQHRFGLYIHNGYGLTETNSPTHIVPLGRRAPVDENSGTLAVGVPTFNTESYIADEEGRPVPIGEVGEIVSKGPMIVPGYWNKPEESAKAIRNGFFHTGDVGFMDEQGWFYLVDRKKDMINAGGYKVWPREVEDVLYTHPAVREAAVVGVPDSYRGETVKAIVSLKANAQVDTNELFEWCKARMAAYKYPRLIEILPELPKTVTGKILRRELRETTKTS